MSNTTSCYDPPFLPSYSLKPVPPLLPPISDLNLSLIVPLVTHWTMGLAFHWFDVKGYFRQYRIHSSAELDKRNKVSRGECLRGVLFNQTLQTLLGVVAGWTGDGDFYGSEDYDIRVWVGRFRSTRRLISGLLHVLVTNTPSLAKYVAGLRPTVPELLVGDSCPTVSAYAPWETYLATATYYTVVPFLQFTLAVLISDSWQYFGHRWMHSNKFMYKHVHSWHHHLSVPYAYGSLYTHPLEGLLQDTVGVALAFGLTGMTIRQGMCFYFASTVKDVYDHCGYSLPWLPIRSDANYHDLHHQSWGMKSNFSVYTSFWDRVFGTLWTDGEAARRNYERCAAVTRRVGRVEKEEDDKKND